MSRLIVLSETVSELHHKIRISQQVRNDVRIWQAFLEGWNGRSVFLSRSVVEAHDLEFYTDAASTLGYGGIFRSAWFSHTWLSNQPWSIAIQELYPIVVAAAVWGSQWTGLRILVHCDNKPAVDALNKGYSNKRIMADILRVLMYYSMRHNFSIKGKHVEGKLNVKSDMLSRLQVKEFTATFPGVDSQPTTVPEDVLDTSKIICGSSLL